MKRVVFITLTIFILFFMEYGLFSGIGGGLSSTLLLVDAIIWTSFFGRRVDGYLLAILGGLLSDMVSPYRFGSITLTLFFTLLATNFLSTRVFTNRALYSYVLISFFSLGVFILSLFLIGFLDMILASKIMIPAVEMTFDAIGSILFLNLSFLAILFLITNSLTKKMHAAFIRPGLK